MTKTVKLTNSYSSIAKKLGSNPLFFCMVDSTTLDRSTIDIPGTAVCSYNEIKDDPANVQILNLKTDAAGRMTRDTSSVHSVVSTNIYAFDNKDSVQEMPDTVANGLIEQNIIEEVS